MATFSVTVPDGQVPRIVADVAKLRGVDISAMTLGQKAAFMKSDLMSYWKDCMIAAEVAAAGSAASGTAIANTLADINANLTVT